MEEEIINSALTTKSVNEYIKETMDFINEHKVLKTALIIFLVAATCKAVYEMGANFGRFLYMIMH